MPQQAIRIGVTVPLLQAHNRISHKECQLVASQPVISLFNPTQQVSPHSSKSLSIITARQWCSSSQWCSSLWCNSSQWWDNNKWCNSQWCSNLCISLWVLATNNHILLLSWVEDMVVMGMDTMAIMAKNGRNTTRNGKRSTRNSGELTSMMRKIFS